MSDHAADSHVRTVYKVVPAAMWARASPKGSFDGSADDLRDGFIHLSSAVQLAGTLAKYFRGQPDLLLIAFNTGDLEPHLKWEASRGGDLFPHYYGSLPTKLALWKKPLPLDQSGLPQLDQDTL